MLKLYTKLLSSGATHVNPNRVVAAQQSWPELEFKDIVYTQAHQNCSRMQKEKQCPCLSLQQLQILK